MTALNWDLEPEYVLILSDSLAISGEDHRPCFMTTKVFSLPHVGLCIAGTGAQPLAERFWAHANSKCIFEDIAHLNNYAPTILCAIWEEMLSHPDYADVEADEITGTVYCYGWSEEKEVFVGFAYRSINDFVSEEMHYGTALKPPPNSGEVPEINGLTDFLSVLIEQKREDRERPRMERVGIGGDVIMTLMSRTDDGFTVIEQRPFFRFEDFDLDWDAILARLPENDGHPRAIYALARDP